MMSRIFNAMQQQGRLLDAGKIMGISQVCRVNCKDFGLSSDGFRHMYFVNGRDKVDRPSE